MSEHVEEPDVGANSYAFQRVVDAIEEAIDIDGVDPQARAALAKLHQEAGRWVGIRPWLTPDDLATLERRRNLLPPRPHREPTANDAKWLNIEGPNGTGQLGLDGESRGALVRANCILIADVERWDREGRLADLPHIGPARLARIRAAVATFREERSAV
jgi:hypothetical protein